MPHCYVSVRQSHGTRRGELLRAVAAAMSSSLGTPPADNLVQLRELDPECFHCGEGGEPDWTNVEVVMFPGRPLEKKRALYEAICAALAGFGIDPLHVRFHIAEPGPENWGMRGGKPASDFFPQKKA